jgi:hypothetical protein
LWRCHGRVPCANAKPVRSDCSRVQRVCGERVRHDAALHGDCYP